MYKPKRNDKPVLLNLPVDLFERVDVASEEQKVTRTQFLRQSVERNLMHYERNERPIFHRLAAQGGT